MINKIVLVFSMLLLTITSIAQQEAFYSVFWNNPSIYNPATTGEQSKFYGAVNYRNQWVNTPGHPISITALFEVRLDSLNSAFGINYSYDQLGLEKNRKLGFNYLYHIDLGENRKIGVGISPTLLTKKINYSQFIAIDDYTQDPSIPNRNETLNFLDLNIGLSYLSERFRAGIGVTSALESNEEVGNRIYQNQRYLFTHASYKVLIGRDFKLIPKVRFATDFTSRSLEANLIAKYNDRYWIGASYRS